MKLSEQTLAKGQGKREDREQEENSTGTIPRVCNSLEALNLPANGGHRKVNFGGFKILFRETPKVSVYFLKRDSLRILKMIFQKWLKEKKQVEKEKQIFHKSAYTMRRSRALCEPEQPKTDPKA